jgi:two-component system, cell cycle sensor histidine kinase and response regulator CckA
MSDLTRHEARLRIAVRAAKVGLWEWDLGARVVYSDEWKRQLGYEPAEIGDDFAEWETRVHPEDLPRMKQLIAAYVANPWPKYDAEFRMRHRDGSWRWILAQGDMVKDAAGTPVRMIGGNVDITEQKRAQMDLRGANRALRMLGDCRQALSRLTDEDSLLREVCRIVVAVGGYRMAWIGLAASDDTRSLRAATQVGFEPGLLESLSPGWADAGGGPAAAAIRERSPCIALLGAPDSSGDPLRDAAIRGGCESSAALPLGRGDVAFGALCIYSADGGAFDGQEMAVLAELADDLAFGMTALRTRAERDKSDAALAETERRLRTLVENFPDFIARFDAEHRLLYANPSMTEALETTPGSLLGRTPLEIGLTGQPGADRALEDGIARALECGVPDTLELTWATARGERRFEVRHIPEKDGTGKATSALGIARDITDCRRAQDALRSQLLMNEAMFDQTVTAVGLLDRDHRFIRVNEWFARNYGKTAQEFAGRSLVEVLPAYAGSYEVTRRHLDEVVRTRKPLHLTNWSYEFVDQPERGLTYWDWILQPISGQGGEVDLVCFSAIDVTVRKRAEEAALAREREFKALADNTPDTIVRWDRNLRRLYANPAAGALAGVSAQKLVGERFGTGYEPGGDAENLESMRTMDEVIRRAFDTGQDATAELVWVTPGGRRVYQGRFAPEFAPDGTITTVLGVARDITALKETQRQFLTLTEHSPDLIVRYDRNGRYLHANSAVERATGIPARELLGRRIGEPTSVRDGAPSHDLLALRRQVEQVVATGAAMETEIRVPLPAGEKVFNVRLIPERDDAGLVTSVLNVSREITASKRAEEALRASEQRFRQVTENIDEVLWLTDPVRKQMIYVSPAYERVWGRTCESLYARPRSWLESVHPEDRARVADGEPNKSGFDLEYRIVLPGGAVRWIRDRSFPIVDADGRVSRVAGVAQDITARRQLEEQLRQAQKMEAIGQLAGGIAHDFNNMLVVIQLHASLLAHSESRSELTEGLQQIMEAAERAANLTRQLLTFSRRDVRSAADIDVGHVTTGMIAMFGRLLGEDIAVDTRLAPDLPLIRGDPGLIEQLLMNLAVNSRDAMPDGGRLVISLDQVAIEDDYAALHPPASPGRFLRLAVSDSGCGIAPEHLPRIFEPFFTTKDVGRGTGLGLATVFGIVQQHRGWIEVTSEVNRGTEFRVFLPALESSAVRASVAAPATAAPSTVSGNETILLVEDDAAVRRLARIVLDRHGYRVLEADSGASALELWAAQTARVDLLLTDLVMPGGMSGHDLAQQMLSLQPGLKIVYTSGYSNDLVNRRVHLEPGRNFLPKPYPAQELAATVRRCLDSAEQ